MSKKRMDEGFSASERVNDYLLGAIDQMHNHNYGYAEELIRILARATCPTCKGEGTYLEDLGNGITIRRPCGRCYYRGLNIGESFLTHSIKDNSPVPTGQEDHD